MAVSTGYRFSQRLHLQTIVTCRLNPLRICLPIVVRTFSTITRCVAVTSSDHFVYIYMYISSENSNVSDFVSVYSLVVKYDEQFYQCCCWCCDRNHQVAYCDSIMEKNRRMTIPETSGNQRGPSRVTNVNPLDSFFPFDPYLLVR